MTDTLLDQMAQQSYRKQLGDLADEAKERGDMENFKAALKSFLEDLPE